MPALSSGDNKLREASQLLASSYLFLKRVMSKCAKPCLAQSPGAPAPTSSLAHGTCACPTRSGERWA